MTYTAVNTDLLCNSAGSYRCVTPKQKVRRVVLGNQTPFSSSHKETGPINDLKGLFQTQQFCDPPPHPCRGFGPWNVLLSAIALTNLVCCEVSCANLAMAGKIRSATALVPDRIRSGPMRSTMSARCWAAHLLTAACRWLQKTQLLSENPPRELAAAPLRSTQHGTPHL